MSQEHGNSIIPYIETAKSEDILGEDSLRLLADPNLRNEVALLMGTPASNISSEDITIVTLLLDDSGSMDHLVPIIHASQHRLIDRLLKESRDPSSILLSTQALNNKNVAPALSKGLMRTTYDLRPETWGSVYRPLDQAVRLNDKNYFAHEATPLVPAVMRFGAAVLLKAQEIRDEWKSVRTISCVLTDGRDTSRIPAVEASGPIKDANRSRRDVMASLTICQDYEREELLAAGEEIKVDKTTL